MSDNFISIKAYIEAVLAVPLLFFMFILALFNVGVMDSFYNDLKTVKIGNIEYDFVKYVDCTKCYVVYKREGADTIRVLAAKRIYDIYEESGKLIVSMPENMKIEPEFIDGVIYDFI